MIYGFALPERILRVYDDKEQQHLLLKPLAAPNMAFVCREMLYFCCKKYSQVTFVPIGYSSGPPSPSTRRFMEPQTTWFCPSADTLVIDLVEPMPRPRMIQDSTHKVAKCEEAYSWKSRMFCLLTALSPRKRFS